MNAVAEPVDFAQASLATTAANVTEAVHIPLLRVRPSPTNPRKHFDMEGLRDLARSIKAHGLLQPILVRPYADPKATAADPHTQYEIVAGERRWRASCLELAGELSTIMAIVRPMSDFEVLEVQLIENLKRSDLHPLEEAAGYEQLLRQPDGLQGYASVDDLAARIGKSPSYVWQRRKLLALCPEAREAFLDGKLALSIAILVARLQPADQVKATTEIVRGWGGEPMTYKAAVDYVDRTFHLLLTRAPFTITDATLVSAAGSCRSCPKRTGANPQLFDDIGEHDTCTDPACYQAKVAAHREQVKAQAEEAGKTVISGAAAKKAKPDRHSDLRGFLELDRVHHTIGDKPLRKLLGKRVPETQLLEDPHTGALVEVVPEAEALAALKEAGIVNTTRMPTTNAAQRDAERKTKSERAWRIAAAAECINQATNPTTPEGREDYRARLLWAVAVTLWAEMDADTHKIISQLLGWPPLRNAWQDGPGVTAAAHITALSADQLAAFFTAAVLAGDCMVSTHSADRKPERLLGAAEQLGVDVAAIRQAQRAQTKTTPDTKAAERARKKAAQQPTPETALAAALKNAAGGSAKRAKAVGPAIRYRCRDTGSAWTGRGLQPAWVKAALASGKTLRDLEVTPGTGQSFVSAAAAAPKTQPATA